jgi:hypothetical protein
VAMQYIVLFSQRTVRLPVRCSGLEVWGLGLGVNRRVEFWSLEFGRLDLGDKGLGFKV